MVPPPYRARRGHTREREKVEKMMQTSSTFIDRWGGPALMLGAHILPDQSQGPGSVVLPGRVCPSDGARKVVMVRARFGDAQGASWCHHYLSVEVRSERLNQP